MSISRQRHAINMVMYLWFICDNHLHTLINVLTSNFAEQYYHEPSIQALYLDESQIPATEHRPAPGRGCPKGGDPGGLNLFGAAPLAFAILLKDTVPCWSIYGKHAMSAPSDFNLLQTWVSEHRSKMGCLVQLSFWKRYCDLIGQARAPGCHRPPC